jgi:hypothetical protein
LDFVRAIFNSSLASGQIAFSSCGADPGRAKKQAVRAQCLLVPVPGPRTQDPGPKPRTPRRQQQPAALCVANSNTTAAVKTKSRSPRRTRLGGRHLPPRHISPAAATPAAPVRRTVHTAHCTWCTGTLALALALALGLGQSGRPTKEGGWSAARARAREPRVRVWGVGAVYGRSLFLRLQPEVGPAICVFRWPRPSS